MSEVFPHGVSATDIYLDSDIADDDSAREMLEYAATAINAYDANQERIAELEGFAVEANSCVSLQRTKMDQQQQEIADQKRQLEDKAKLIKGVDKANGEMALEIELLKKQISQLKAENLSIAAYAGQRINMLKRANDKLGGES